MVRNYFGGIFVIALVAMFLLSFGCIDNKTGAFTASSSDSPVLKIGYQKGPISTLAIIAKEKGYFEQEGVNIELSEFTAGKLALQAFLGGSVDFAIVGDLPVALAKTSGNNFVVVSQVIAKTHNENRIIALKDSNAISIQDYFSAKHRKVGTFLGGTAEFYLHEFLRYYNISGSDYPDITSGKPEDMVAMLTSGSVDAVSIFEPYPTIAEGALGDKAISYTLPPTEYNTMYILTAHSDFVKDHPEELKKIFRALILAEDYVKNNQAESKNIISKITGFDLQKIESIWPAYDFGLALDKETLVSTWDKEINWEISSGKLPQSTVIPDFNSLISDETLKSVLSGK